MREPEDKMRRRPPQHGADPVADVECQMVDVLAASVRAADPLLQIVSHCARVAALADWLAAELDVEPEGREVLREAATLHEVGMVAVPTRLLDKPAPLSDEELDLVRAQARIGSNVVRATRGRRPARLIENQYSDYEELRRRLGAGSDDLLLAGILRAADVFDAMCYPRPYQHSLSAAYRAEVFRNGRGTKFHPRVVPLMLRNAP